MSRLAVLAVPFVAALLTTLLTVPPVMRLAISKHWLDEPDGVRRSHVRPVPRLGGVAIFAGVFLAFGAAPLIGLVSGAVPSVPHLTSALLLSSGILFLLGLWDDLRGIPPLMKLAGQTLAALVLVYAGFRVDVLVLPPNYQFSLGWLSIPVTVVWLVGVSNALNLVDGMDGLAGGIGIIALLTATAAALVVGNVSVPWYTLALGGALLGFLKFNFPPAKIFLGDSGSLVVGFLLSVLTVKGATRPDHATYALAPIFALSFPLLDTGIAMLRRWLRGTPLSRADARHIHHQLRALGLPARKAVILIYVEATVVATMGLCVTFAPPRLTVAVAGTGAAILLFIMVYGVRWLEYHEFLEAGASVTSAARQARWVIQDKINARDVAMLIRKADTFEQMASIIEESAPIFRFSHMELGRGSSPRHLPDHIAGELHTARFCKLEYPVANPSQRHNDGLTLNIWCTTEALRRPVGAERVARIIAPAVGNWLEVAHLPLPAAPPTVSTTVAAAGAPLASSTPVQFPGPVPVPERERPRRSVRPPHAAGDPDRRSGIGMAARAPSRGDEMRT